MAREPNLSHSYMAKDEGQWMQVAVKEIPVTCKEKIFTAIVLNPRTGFPEKL